VNGAATNRRGANLYPRRNTRRQYGLTQWKAGFLIGWKHGFKAGVRWRQQHAATATARLIVPRVPPGAAEFFARLAERRARRRGQPKGASHHPDFLPLVVDHAWTYRDTERRLPSADILAESLGVSRTTYFAWLTANNFTSTSIKIAATKRTISDGVSYLLSL